MRINRNVAINVGVFLLVMLILEVGFAKCIGFDFGPPNFCAKVTLTEKYKTFEENCYFYGIIDELKVTYPKKNEYEQFKGVLQRRKRKTVFKGSGSLCAGEFKQHQVSSLIVARCNDNLIMGQGFLEYWGIVPPLSDFYFAENPSVSYWEKGDFSKISVSCDDKSTNRIKN